MAETFEFTLPNAFNDTTLNISAAGFRASDPNDFYAAGDLTWMSFSSSLVLLMVPGVGLFYSGQSESCSALSMMWMSMMTTSLLGVQWFLWGYSITFSEFSTLWGGANDILLRNDLTIPWGSGPGAKIPQLLHCLYQGMFACFTGAVVSGAVIRKGRPMFFLIFIFIWATVVYDPIARSTWNPLGWSNYWKGHGGVFDFAGGTIVAATTAAAYSVFCKWRRQIFPLKPRLSESDVKLLNRKPKPHNVSNVVLGTALLWIGWFGFNGGSALGANLRGISACISTHLAACAGGLVGALMYYFATFWKDESGKRPSHAGKFSILAFCNGAVAGLVAVTPAAGYIPYWSGPIFGIVGSVSVAFCSGKGRLYFDTNDIFVVHGIAGWAGMLLTPGLARASIAELDGYTVVVNQGWEQLGIQVADALVGTLWSFVGSLLILIVMEFVVVCFRYFKWIADEPAFQLILDQDIIIESELGDRTPVTCACNHTGNQSHVSPHMNGYQPAMAQMYGAGGGQAPHNGDQNHGSPRVNEHHPAMVMMHAAGGEQASHTAPGMTGAGEDTDDMNIVGTDVSYAISIGSSK